MIPRNAIAYTLHLAGKIKIIAMSDQILTISLRCNGCGAGLVISPDMKQLACGYCGLNQIVERKGGGVYLRELSEVMTNVQVATDKTAAELAITRLQKELAALQLQRINYKKEGHKYVYSIGSIGTKISDRRKLAIGVGLTLISISYWWLVNLSGGESSGSIGTILIVTLVVGILLLVIAVLKRSKQSRFDLDKVEQQRQEVKKQISKGLQYYDSQIDQKAAELRKNLARAESSNPK